MTDPLIILFASGSALAAGSLLGVLICEAVKNRAERKSEEQERADRSVEASLCVDLDPYLAGQVRELNEQNSTGRVVPLRRAG